MKEGTMINEPEPADSGHQDKRNWTEPEISEPKSLIGNPEGVILQAVSGNLP
jgi:hypothetical protein